MDSAKATVTGAEKPAGADAARGRAVIGACSLLTLVFGSVHAFSVLLTGLETTLHQDRAAVSLTYSLALAALTLAVLAGHRVFGRLRPALFVTLVTATAAAGLIAAAATGTLAGWWLGYGLIFGAANGLAYGYGLQFAAQANPGRPGMAMGLVTAVYALGASLAAPALAAAQASVGPGGALVLLAAVIVAAGIVAALILARAGLAFQSEPRRPAGTSEAAGPILAWWLGYGLGVAAGLMTAGQAAGMAAAAGLSLNLAVAATAAFAVANMAGGLAAGWAADRFALKRLLALLPLLSAAAAMLLLVKGGPLLVLIAIAGLGGAYGALIALYPAAVAGRFGVLAAPRVYGRVFTAWGLAGLAAPWFSATLYDATGSYALPLGISALVSVASSLTAFAFL